MPAAKKNKYAVKSEHGAATEWVQVRVTSQTKAGWERAAKRAGLSLSEWIREVLAARAS